MELKDVGIVIYRHTITSSATAGKVPEVKFRPGDNTPDSEFNNIPVGEMKPSSVFNNAIIMLNTGNTDIISEDLLSEFDIHKISCPRCRFIMEHTKLLLKSVPVISKSNIKGVCNLCKLKQQTSHDTCTVCDENIRKFATADKKDDQRREAFERKDDVEKRILSKGQHFMEHDEEKSRAYLDFDINKNTLDKSLFRSKVDPLISELEIFKPVLGLDSSAYINADQAIKNRNKVIFKKSITSDDKLLKPVYYETKLPKKTIMKSTKQSSFSPYHYGDAATSSEKEDTTKLRRYHSDESLLPSFSAINEELFIKQFKFFFPHMIKKEEKKIVISSSDLLMKTRDKLKAEGEEKIRQQEEICKQQEAQKRKKEVARLAIKAELEMKKELTQHIDKNLLHQGMESKTEKRRRSKSTPGSVTSLTEDEHVIKTKKKIRKQSVESFDDEKRHSAYNDQDEYHRRDTKLSKSGIDKDKEKKELIDKNRGQDRQFGKKHMEKPGREEAIRSENEKVEKHEKVMKEKDVGKGEQHEKNIKEKYKESSRKAEDKNLEKERDPEKEEISSKKSKYRRESEKNTKELGNDNLSKSRDNKEAEYKQQKEKSNRSKDEKPKRDEIIAKNPDNLSKDRSTFKDSKEETTTKKKQMDKKTDVQDRDKKQHDEFSQLKIGKTSQLPVETDRNKGKLPISKDTHKEMEIKKIPEENKIKKSQEEASLTIQKFEEPSSSKASKPAMENLKEVPKKEQNPNVPLMSKPTKKELLPNQKDAAKKGQYIDELSPTSKETKKEQQYKQKELVENGQNIGEPKLASKGTNKEPTSKLREATNIGQKVEELSPASKGTENEPISKQKEATETRKNVKTLMLVSKDAKKISPESKLKKVSEKGQNVEEPPSLSKETKKEPLSQQKKNNEKGQKVQESMVLLKDTKNETPSKLKEATEKGQKIEIPPSVSTGTKKDMLPSPKLKEDIKKGQKIAESSDSKTSKKQLPPPPSLKEQPQKAPNKNELNLLNKLLTQQENEKGDDKKTRQAIEEQLKKAGEVTEKLKTLPDPLKSKPVFKETKKEPQTQQTAKEQKQKAEQQGPVIDLKDIKIQISGNDLISKMVATRRQPVNEEKHLKTVTQPLPEKPIKQIIVRKKPSSLSLSSLISESVQGKKSLTNEIIFGETICKKNEVPVKRKTELQPSMFKSSFTKDRTTVGGHAVEEIKLEPVKDKDSQGVLRYALSDRKYIVNGWTVLPTEKIVRKMNIYRMHPAHPEFDWFKHNKSKGAMQYCSGERLAEFDDNGCGRWYYRNGRIALDYYDSEEINTQQRIVIYSSGEPDQRGRSSPVTVLGVFDYMGNGAVFDHSGKIRLKYTQDEGVVLDRALGPVSHWKWHSLNDPPVLQQVMIDCQMPYPDPTIMELNEEKKRKTPRADAEMLNIEYENYSKEKQNKMKETYQPYQIKMKALKINDQFSLRILDQASIYLLYRDGTTTLKLNLGMVLDQNEIVDTGITELGQVACAVETVPAASMSVAMLQHSLDNARQCDRVHAEREQRLRPQCVVASADRLIAPLSRPLRPTIRALSDSTSNINQCQCKHRKPSSYHEILYYNNRLI